VGDKMGRKPKGYWQNSDNYTREMENAIEVNGGERPTQRWLRENGYWGLSKATRYHGGLTFTLNSLSENLNSERPKGFWKNKDNFHRELKKAIEANDGKRPGRKWLLENGFSSLVTAAKRYYGGITEHLDQLTNPLEQKPRGYWRDEENFYRELDGAIKKNDGNRPTETWLNENGYATLVDVANRVYGSLVEILERYTVENGRIKNGKLKDKENLWRELGVAVELNNGERPTKGWLENNGYSSIVSSSYRYHRGLTRVLDEYFSSQGDEDHLGSLLEEYVGGGE